MSTNMSSHLKILSYNVNSLKACMKNHQYTKLNDFLDSLGADIVCLQETKLSAADADYISCSLLARDDKDEEVDRYEGFLSFCEKKPGYSGVATFVNSRRLLPHTVEIGLFVPGSVEHARLLQHVSSERLDELNSEGRVVVTYFDKFVLFNIYGPAVSSDTPERMAFKMDFYTALHVRCQGMTQKRIVIVGDFNIAPSPMDSSFYNPCHSISRPDRLWMREFLSPSGCSKGGGFVDCFRLFWPHRSNAYTAWNQKVNARDNNYGSRIDLCVAKGFDGGDVRIDASDICPDVLGSDHCPVYVTLSTPLPGGFDTPFRPVPREAIRFTVGTQRIISSYFTAGGSDTPISHQMGGTRNNKRPSKQANLTALLLRSDADEDASSASESQPIRSGWLEDEYRASEEYTRRRQADAKRAWKIIQDTVKVPTCRHGLEAALKKVRKNSKYKGRMFYCCPKSAGAGPQGQCNFFQWVSNSDT